MPRIHGQAPPELSPPCSLPAECATIYRIFKDDLIDCRQVVMGGIGTLTHQEVEAYQRLMGIYLTPFEVRALLSIDRVFVSVNSVKPKPKPNQPPKR